MYAYMYIYISIYQKLKKREALIERYLVGEHDSTWRFLDLRRGNWESDAIIFYFILLKLLKVFKYFTF